MVEVKIFGPIPGCAKCKATEDVAKLAAQEYGDKVVVKKYDIMSKEADEYGIMMSPALVVEDIVVSAGKVPNESEIKKAINMILSEK